MPCEPWSERSLVLFSGRLGIRCATWLALGALAACLLVALCGCSEQAVTPTDASAQANDAGRDSAQDASRDSAQDASRDSAQDASRDSADDSFADAVPSCQLGYASVGAWLDAAKMGAASWQNANDVWESWTGKPNRVRRDYRAPSDFKVDPRYQVAANDGIKMLITLKPAFNPVSSVDLANLETFLQTIQGYGLKAEICLWHEPYYAGLTVTQFHSMIQYYGPTVRKYYPLVFVSTVGAVENNNENAYYLSGSFDKVATDYYTIHYVHGYRLDTAASIADADDIPFGVWEFNGNTTAYTHAQIIAHFDYIKTFFENRAAAGKPNADIVFFNGSGPNATVITSSSDFRLPWLTSLYDAACTADL